MINRNANSGIYTYVDPFVSVTDTKEKYVLFVIGIRIIIRFVFYSD